MKIYISGPVTGTCDYRERFAEAEGFLRERHPDCEVVNPVRVLAELPGSTSWEEYMRMSLAMLNMCEAVFLMKDWKESTGACIEYGVSLANGKIIVEEGEKGLYETV